MMNLDILILKNAAVALLFFLVLHLIILRLIRQENVIVWIMRITAVCLVFNIAVWAINLCQKDFGLMPIILGAAVSSYLFLLLALFYVLAFFGMMESSLRIRLLMEIADKEKGISEKEILAKYNCKNVITKRIRRLVNSGDIVEKGGYMSIGKKLSYFQLHTLLFNLFKK